MSVLTLTLGFLTNPRTPNIVKFTRIIPKLSQLFYLDIIHQSSFKHLLNHFNQIFQTKFMIVLSRFTILSQSMGTTLQVSHVLIISQKFVANFVDNVDYNNLKYHLLNATILTQFGFSKRKLWAICQTMLFLALLFKVSLYKQ